MKYVPPRVEGIFVYCLCTWPGIGMGMCTNVWPVWLPRSAYVAWIGIDNDNDALWERLRRGSVTLKKMGSNML